MNVKVNGKERTFDKGQVSIEDLLKIDDIDRPEMVNVQLNGEFIKKESYGSTHLNEGDEIDFLYFLGGGNTK